MHLLLRNFPTNLGFPVIRNTVKTTLSEIVKYDYSKLVLKREIYPLQFLLEVTKIVNFLRKISQIKFLDLHMLYVYFVAILRR